MSITKLTDAEKEAIINTIIIEDDAGVARIETIAAESCQKFEFERRTTFDKTGELPPMSLEYQSASLTRLIANEVTSARRDDTDVNLREVAKIPTPQHTIA